MKFPLCALLILSALCVSAANPQPQEEETRLSEVVVFPQMARVSREMTLSIQTGESVVRGAGLPPNFREETLTAEVIQGSGVAISAVSVQTEYLNVRSDTAVEKARRQCERLAIQLTNAKNRLAAVQNEMNSFQSLSPTLPEGRKTDPAPLTFSTEDWQKLSDLTKTELMRKQIEARSLDSAITELNYRKSVADLEYQKVSANHADARKILLITLRAAAPGKVTLRFSYLIDGASWSPAYDLRVNPADTTTTFVSYGLIRQNTGEDWTAVPIVLSTANPAFSADLPTLTGRVISEQFVVSASPVPLASFSKTSATGWLSRGKNELAKQATISSVPQKFAGKSKRQYERRKNQVSAVQSNMIDRQSAESKNQIELLDGEVLSECLLLSTDRDRLILRKHSGETLSIPFDQIAKMSNRTIQGRGLDIAPNRLIPPDRDAGGFDYRYPTARLETILSDNQYRRILLKSTVLPGERYYEAYPGLTENTYLICRTTNCSGAPILPGPANLFYGSDYVSDMDLQRMNINESWNLPLGVDPRIKIKRKIFKTAKDVGMWTARRETQISTEISVTNDTEAPVKLRVYDGIPVSTDENLTLSAISAEPAATQIADKKNGLEPGLYVWHLDLIPHQTLPIALRYKITYPADKIVLYGEGIPNIPGFGPAIDNAATQK